MSNLKSFHALCRQHNISSSQYSISQRAHLGHFGLAYYLNNYADSVQYAVFWYCIPNACLDLARFSV